MIVHYIWLVLVTNVPLNETVNNCVSDLHKKNLYKRENQQKRPFQTSRIATSKSSLLPTL